MPVGAFEEQHEPDLIDLSDNSKNPDLITLHWENLNVFTQPKSSLIQKIKRTVLETKHIVKNGDNSIIVKLIKYRIVFIQYKLDKPKPYD